jgi:DNA-directed RNA polymerase subunit RPC12/RpoP
MTLSTRCQRCGSPYEASKEDVIRGDWIWCPACRLKKPSLIDTLSQVVKPEVVD